MLIKKGETPEKRKRQVGILVLLVRIVEGLMDEVVKCLRRFRV